MPVWDGYIWIRDHCHSAVFAGKFDSDAVFLLGNLIALLLQYPVKRFYGGRVNPIRTIEPRKENTTTIHSTPFDYPEERRFSFCSGAAFLLSLDSIDYLVAGAQYEPFFMCADDLMTGLKVVAQTPEMAQTPERPLSSFSPIFMWIGISVRNMFIQSNDLESSRIFQNE